MKALKARTWISVMLSVAVLLTGCGGGGLSVAYAPHLEVDSCIITGNTSTAAGLAVASAVMGSASRTRRHTRAMISAARSISASS